MPQGDCIRNRSAAAKAILYPVPGLLRCRLFRRSPESRNPWCRPTLHWQSSLDSHPRLRGGDVLSRERRMQWPGMNQAQVSLRQLELSGDKVVTRVKPR